jgi:hypothetical protein
MKIQIEVFADDGSVFRGEAILQRISKTQSNSKPTLKAKVNCPMAIARLWQGGEFKSPISFSQIKSHLTGDGFNFPDNTLMMAISSAGFLTRRGSKGSYKWSQRHPYNG